MRAVHDAAVPAPSVAVVVCAYTLNRWDDLTASLASAAAQVPAPAEILLVVDHNDELLERARRELAAVHSTLRILGNDRQRGLSGARNTALANTQADIVAFLDDDAAAEPGWLARLVAPYADPSVIAVGGSANPVWPSGFDRPWTLPRGPESLRGELDWVVGSTYQGQPETPQPVRNLMGCNMSFRRAVFVTVGGFSEDLGRVGTVPLGCEETELCIRARQAFPGAEIVFEPAARVNHRVSRDRLTWSYLWRRCYAEGLSKAAVSSLVGREDALSTERRYATRVLPGALLRELGQTLRPTQGTRSRHVGSSAAIVAGLAATVLGYVRGRWAAPAVKGSAPALPAPAQPPGHRLTAV
jgi:glucosyl-dolichyl phosphate glucuronosyltransferase